jgi:hypothetical protein
MFMPERKKPGLISRVFYLLEGQSTTARLSVPSPVSSFLAFPEEHFVAHHRFIRVFVLHVLDVGVVIRHADHQACSLTEVFTEATQVIEHAE